MTNWSTRAETSSGYVLSANSTELMHERLRYYIQVWVDWMRCPEVKLGFPSKSSGFVSAGISGFDDMSDSVENTDALIVDAVITDLPESERMAIFHVHLASVFTFRRKNIQDEYEKALVNLWRGILQKGSS